MKVRYVKLRPNAKEPVRTTEGAVGYDLYCAEKGIIYPHQIAIIPTGIAIELPKGYEAQIRGRSGLAVRGILVHTGTIDSDYRGEIKVIVYNLGKSFSYDEDTRIAQLVINKIELPEFMLVDTLSETERGEKGLGSTGGF